MESLPLARVPPRRAPAHGRRGPPASETPGNAAARPVLLWRFYSPGALLCRDITAALVYRHDRAMPVPLVLVVRHTDSKY